MFKNMWGILMKEYRGSEWRKWDLHVHTPASYQHNFRFSDEEEKEKYNGDIWEKYIDELEKIQHVAVIGITDYFSIEGYKKILEYRKKGRLQNFYLILPNIEFRLDKFLSSRKDEQPKRLNYHVIFSNEIDPEIIEKEFLEELHIKTPNGEVRKLTRRNIEEIGRILKKQHDKFKNYSDYFVGCMNITVSLDEIIKVLKEKESIFGGKYLLVLPEERWCLMDWDGQDHLTRKELLVKSHAIFSANPNTRDWALGKKHKNPKDFIDEFGSLKPCIHGSDAHSFDKLCKPDNNRFCWIKADPTFEGLKQIIYEPEERVRIQEDNPEPRKNIYTLSYIKISNSKISDELEIEELEIPLNPNLVTVIGGKGSGKTALLDLIANCFEDRCKRSGIDKNSFVQRIEEQKPDLTVEISFIGDDVENFSKKLIEEKFFQHSKITYLPQGKIEEYSEDREKLHEKIKEIIFSNKDVMDSEYKQKFEKLLEEIDILKKDIEDLNSEIYKLEIDTDPEKVKDIENKKSIKIGELKDKENKLQDIIKKIGEDSENKVKNLRKEEAALRSRHSKLETIKNDLLKLQDKIENFLVINSEIDKLNSNFRELNIPVNISHIDLKSYLDKINETMGIVQSEINNVVGQINSIKEDLNKLLGIEKEHDTLLNEINNINDEIELLDDKLKEINEKKEKIKKLDEERKDKYIKFIQKHIELKDVYKKIIEVFSNGKDDILNNIDFKSNIFFDRSKFEDVGEDILDGRKVTLEQISNLAEKLYEIISSDDIEKLPSKIEDYINEAFKFKQFLKKTRTNLDFYNWVFGNYFSLSTEIFFNGTPMDKLSIGQKGTVLLKIFLAEGDHPLIIDQPEDNLDNKFIYETLVNAFREAKKKRQIIISTHNANLVVNTDAEQVIVAEFKNNKISYRWGSIENEQIRKDITKLLEGGEEAFKKREEKYGI
jgi:ABC-type lipoprotein export system ATPase subunit